MKICKKYFYLRKIYYSHDNLLVPTRSLTKYLKIPKGTLYELRSMKLLKHYSSPPIEVYNTVVGTDKISGYWKITDYGLDTIVKYFPDTEEDIAITKKESVKRLLRGEENEIILGIF